MFNVGILTPLYDLNFNLYSAVEQYISLLPLNEQILIQNNAFTRWVKTAAYSSTRRVAPFEHIFFVSFTLQYAYTESACFLESTPKPAQLRDTGYAFFA